MLTNPNLQIAFVSSSSSKSKQRSHDHGNQAGPRLESRVENLAATGGLRSAEEWRGTQHRPANMVTSSAAHGSWIHGALMT